MNEYPTYLIHYGVPGQKWGTRQYQNLDGTWTEEGKRRRRIGDDQHFSDDKIRTGNQNPVSTSSKTNFAKSIKADVQAINGGRRGHEYGFNRNENCAFCSVSYELRRRGQDVRAQESLRGVMTGLTNKNGAFGKIIPNFAKVSKTTREFAKRANDSSKMRDVGMTKKEYDEMTNTLLQDGEGSRGFITVDWKGGYGGHIFNYEVNGGKLYFIDAQPGTINKADKSYFNQVFANANNIETLRMDNVKMDEDKAKKYYSEDTTTDIRINPAAAKETGKVLIGALAGMAIGSLAAVPHVGAMVGMEIASAISQKKIKELDDEASIELQNKWEKEGRMKEKWYDYKEEKKKDSDNSISDAKMSRINSLVISGLSYKEIAKKLGISTSTVSKYAK